MEELQGPWPLLQRVLLSPLQRIAQRLDPRREVVRDEPNVRQMRKVGEEAAVDDQRLSGNPLSENGVTYEFAS